MHAAAALQLFEDATDIFDRLVQPVDDVGKGGVGRQAVCLASGHQRFPLVETGFAAQAAPARLPVRAAARAASRSWRRRRRSPHPARTRCDCAAHRLRLRPRNRTSARSREFLGLLATAFPDLERSPRSIGELKKRKRPGRKLPDPPDGIYPASAPVHPWSPAGLNADWLRSLELVGRHLAGLLVANHLVAELLASTMSRIPARSTAEMWTKTSAPPLSG